MATFKSNALDCKNKMDQLRNDFKMACKAVLHNGCISNVETVVGQGVMRVNDVFAIVYQAESKT